MALADDDEMTELIDADFPRVDLVGKGANGIPRFLIAKQDADSRGLVPPEMVRDLIAKAEPDPEPATGQVTMTGSPAAIAAFIHKASVRQAPDTAAIAADVAKAEMKTAAINDLPDSAFGYVEPGGKKDAEGKTTPRSLRHFPIHDKAHADDAAARIAQGAKFGDKAKGKVEAAQRKFGEKVSKDAMGPELDDGIDQLDPTVPLCAPEDDAPGDPTDPGSPAWEAIDAATAQKWTSIAVRLKNALSVMAEREMLEAASADPCDAENAFDLEDAMCAVDYVIDTLAGFAVDEQAEADLGGEAMDAVGKSAVEQITGLGDRIITDARLRQIRKAMGADSLPADLSAVETLGAVAKSGRVLSAANEAHIREAAQRLTTVLSSLPQAPITDDGQPVAKSKEKPVAATQTETVPDAPVAKDAAPSADEQARDAGPVNAGGVTEALPGDVLGRQVMKADDDGGKPAAVLVYDADGNPAGTCDPKDITPLANVKAPAKTDDAPPEVAAEPAPDASDMTPQPPADAGTPADATDDGTVAKSSDQDVYAVLEGIVSKAVAAALDGRPAQDIAKQADVAGLAQVVELLKARLETVEAQPAAPKVFTNGQVPPASQLRGQDQGAGQQVDVAKAMARRREFLAADPAEQNRLANEMGHDAIDTLTAIHAAGARL